MRQVCTKAIQTWLKSKLAMPCVAIWAAGGGYMRTTVFARGTACQV